MINLKNFGVVADGITDDTEVIQLALDHVGSFKGCLYAPAGTYRHTGLVIPRDTTLIGDGQTATIFKMLDNINPEYNIRIGGPNVNIRDIYVHGNSQNNTTGNGIDCVRTGLYFSGIDNVQVRLCPDTGIVMVSCHSGHLKNSSIDRCNIGIDVERSVVFTIDSCDVARFLEAGIHFRGSSGHNVCSATNIYQEVSTTPPLPGASFLKFTNFRDRDQVNVSDVYMNGHYSDHDNDLVAVHIDNPITKMDVVRLNRITMKDIKASLLMTNITGPDKIGRVSITDVSYLDETPVIQPEYGLITDAINQ